MSNCTRCNRPGHNENNCIVKICHLCYECDHNEDECSLKFCPHCYNYGHGEAECTTGAVPVPRTEPYTLGASFPHCDGDQASENADNNSGPYSVADVKLPAHWMLSKCYDSLDHAIAGLGLEEKVYNLCDVGSAERKEVERLMVKTWKMGVVGLGLDARNLSHNSIKVNSVQRIENPGLFEKYGLKKQSMLRSLKYERENREAFTPVEQLPGSSGPVATTCLLRNLHRRQAFTVLPSDIDGRINEHYLFHGTKAGSVLGIARDGLDARLSVGGMLGQGVYAAECSTKSDQYTDDVSNRTDSTKKMFLVRVLLGETFISKGRNTHQRPPCKGCRQDSCDCPHAKPYDSVLDDCGRLFREFVVYEQCQCYPEYLVTYTRVYATPATHQAPYQAMFKKTSNVCCITWKKLRDVIIATMIVALIHAFALVFYGVSQVGECPAMPYTPLYLQLQGVFTIILFSTTPGLACTMHKIKDEWAEVLVWPVFVVLCIIVANGLYLLLQIAGYILVIPKANAFSSVHASNLSNDSDTHDNYCNPSVYYYAYVTTVWHTIVYVFYIVWMTELCFRHTNCCKGLAEYILGFAGLIVGTIGSVVMSGFCFGATDYVLKKTDATVCPTTNNLWILELVTGFLLCPLAILCLCVVLGCNGRCHIVSSWCSSLYITATFAVHIFGFVYLNETYSLPKDCVTDEVKFVHFNNCGGTLVSFLWVSLIQCYVTDFRFKAN